MKQYTCITSMTQKMHDHIGSVMIDSWNRYFPEPHSLIVYAENCKINSFPRVIIKDWHDECYDDWYRFSQKTSNTSSQRFAKKGFAFLKALENCNTRFIIWLDADILFLKKFPQEKLESILPDGKLISLFDCFYQEIPNYSPEEYLNTRMRKQMGAESGFVIIDTHHQNFLEYRTKYRELYNSKNQPDECRLWYDGEVVIESARPFLNQVFDLSALRTTNKTQTPLNRSWMAEYFTHQKGRSKRGYTKEELQNFTK